MENNSSSENKISVNIVLSVYFFSLVLHGVWNQYYLGLNEGTFGMLFAVGGDLPATVTPNLYKPILGSHFFGDLLDGHDIFPIFPSGAYFGVSYLFFWITKSLRYEILFWIYALTAIFLAFISIKRWLRLVLKENKVLVYVLHFAYPFIFASDRGQMHLIFGYLLAIAFSYLIESNESRDKLWLGQIILGIALSIKIFPVLIVLGLNRFWSFKKWRLLFSSFILLCVSTPLISFYLTNSIFYPDFSAGLYNDDEYFEKVLIYNTSLKAMLFHINEVSFFKPLEIVVEVLFTNYLIFYVIFTLFASVCLLSKPLTFPENLLAFSILSISIIPISAVYTQTLVCAVALTALTENQIISRKRHNLFWFVVLISTAPINIPLRAKPYGGYEVTFQAVVVPLVQHSYLFSLIGIALISVIRSLLSRLSTQRLN